MRNWLKRAIGMVVLLLSLSSGLRRVEAAIFDTIADRVLGQANFDTRDSGVAPDQMNFPVGVSVDRRSGRIYVADWDNQRVLGWPDASAFSNGESALYVITNSPSLDATSVAVDSTGRVYVADYVHNRILRFPNPASPAADLVLGQADFSGTNANRGGTTPQDNTLYSPWSLAIDSNDDLLVADTFNHRVLVYRKPPPPLDFVNGMKADRVLGQTSFTSNSANYNGVTGSSMNRPRAVSVDESGNVYVADSDNNRVLKFTSPLGDGGSNGMSASLVIGQATFGGSAANAGGSTSDSGFGKPYGLAIDYGAQWLYVADTFNNRVIGYKAPFATGIHATLVFGQSNFAGNFGNRGSLINPGADTLYQPYGIATDTTGDLYIADANNHRVLGYDGVFCCSLLLPIVSR